MIPGRLDERVADELLAETRGNPLALLELPRGLSAAQLAGGFGLPGALSLSGRIEESFLQRLEALPAETRRLLLVAAAEPSVIRALLGRAAERLGITGAALEPAESAGLIEIDGRVRFRHPLVRSAIYRAAAPNDRRQVHRALGEATDARVDPDRRAWHLAEAAAGPTRTSPPSSSGPPAAPRRGAVWPRPLPSLSAPPTLTPEPVAPCATGTGGGADQVRSGRARATRSRCSPPPRPDPRRPPARPGAPAARSDRVRLEARQRRPPLLLSAARELEALDPHLARATYLEALSAAMFAGRLPRRRGGRGEQGGARGPAAATPAAPVGSPPRWVGAAVHRGLRGGQQRCSSRR